MATELFDFAPAGRRASRMAAFHDLVRTWDRRQRERQLLAKLSDRILSDIDRSRGDIMQEATRPFWRA